MSKVHKFEGSVTRVSFGKLTFTVIFLPDEIYKKLKHNQKGRIRAEVTIKGVSHHCGIQPAGEDRYFIMLSKKLLKEMRLKVGDEIDVQIARTDPDRVDLPEELEQALKKDKGLKKSWEKLTPGRRRSYVHMISTAKLKETRLKRIRSIFESLEGDGLDIDDLREWHRKRQKKSSS